MGLRPFGRGLSTMLRSSSSENLVMGMQTNTTHESSAALIETRSLSRKVGDRTLVDNVSVSVAQGEILVITGPSGAGKSSFLRLINRLDEPTSGLVLVRGQDYTQIGPSALRKRVGMVMQAANLFPGSVKQNLLYGPTQHHETVTDGQIDALLSQVGLTGRANTDVATLSGGEAQRVSFARTLANMPEVLLLDEPTSALDEDTARGIERLVVDIAAERKMACLIVTHNVAQAARIAPRTMYLVNGRVTALGPTKEVLDAYESH